MNSTLRVAMSVGFALSAAVLLYPPWSITVTEVIPTVGPSVDYYVGHAPLFCGIKDEPDFYTMKFPLVRPVFGSHQIETVRLTCELALIWAFTFVVVYPVSRVLSAAEASRTDEPR